MIATLWKFQRQILFKMDAEKAHRWTVAALRFLKMGAFGDSVGNFPLRVVSGAPSEPPAALSKEVFGFHFPSAVGLAAGFDKDCEILAALPYLGFGFAEIGTITPRPQKGNDRPRLFRDPARQALFNRMGFNNEGALVVSKRLEHVRARLPGMFRVGVNLGMNKTTAAEDAKADYLNAAKPFRGLADYLVINVSSPNTPGLRSLQNIESLRPIVGELLAEIQSWNPIPPLLLKLAPEVRGENLFGLIEAGEKWGLKGWILTNTWAGEWKLERNQLTGGWSGKILTQHALDSLIEARKRTKLPIISVGGIMSAKDARDRLSNGADLVQIYTGWIYGGPQFPYKLACNLASKTQKP